MNPHFKGLILKATNASALLEVEIIQHLWSGYGKILRVRLKDSELKSVVVKQVHWPDTQTHPRGWNSTRSHERKVRSYQVETTFYKQWASRCAKSCRVPRCFALETHGDEIFIVLEDLNAAGFDERRARASNTEIKACLSWLAHFHASFMGESPEGLWKTGTYWHLATRPDELAQLNDPTLKKAASAIDLALNRSPFQTLVHGDAKRANFCFSTEGRVAAVDFQYVGGGCGMKDIAYFLGSGLSEEACEQQEDALLDYYFQTLKTAQQTHGHAIDFTALEADWRALYPVAWTDFFRFLQGWSPGHRKIHRYSKRLAREALKRV